MFRISLHDDARRDLENLWSEAPTAAARITVLLEELEANPDLQDRLTQQDFGAYESADFHVSKWFAQWNNGKDLWRLKVWDLENQRLRYRVVYALMRGRLDYCVLGIVPRTFNYDNNHELTRRILAAHQEL